MRSSDVSDESLKRGYESSDANAKGIFVTGVGALAGGFAVFLVAWVLFLAYTRAIRSERHPPSAVSIENAIPPEPRLQLNPQEDMRKLLEENRRVLDSAAWVDREGGWVRIPIEDAMKLLVKRSHE